MSERSLVFIRRVELLEVRFKDHGLDAIEVIDNGVGIAPVDYDVVGE
jgi:DNA mismatch repair ATPase MutL